MQIRATQRGLVQFTPAAVDYSYLLIVGTCSPHPCKLLLCEVASLGNLTTSMGFHTGEGLERYIYVAGWPFRRHADQ